MKRKLSRIAKWIRKVPILRRLLMRYQVYRMGIVFEAVKQTFVRFGVVMTDMATEINRVVEALQSLDKALSKSKGG